METDLIEVFVEIPRGSRDKYELDKERGVMMVGWQDARVAHQVTREARALHDRGMEGSYLP